MNNAINKRLEEIENYRGYAPYRTVLIAALRRALEGLRQITKHQIKGASNVSVWTEQDIAKVLGVKE